MNAHEAGAREADRRGPIRDPDVLARVARILRPNATNGAAKPRGAAANTASNADARAE